MFALFINTGALRCLIQPGPTNFQTVVFKADVSITGATKILATQFVEYGKWISLFIVTSSYCLVNIAFQLFFAPERRW